MSEQNEIQMTRQQVEEAIEQYKKVYTIVRLLTRKSLEEEQCTPPWKNEHPCTRCISREALIDQCQKCKLETTKNKIFYATSRYVEVDGEPSVIEMVQEMDATAEEEFAMDKRLYTDALTGAYNRRYYEENLRRKFLTAGVAMIDLDDFKLCNDTFGHQAGDKVLETVAGIIQQNIRATDFLVRYGGDELLLILPNIPRDNFVRKLTIINKKLSMAIVHGFERVKISASIGGVLSAGVAIEEAVQQADKRMYQAKRQKNAVVTDSNGMTITGAQPKTKPMILVVDDSEMNREILKEILRDDFRIVEAASGVECLKMVEAYSNEISLILLDIVMPDMDGFEVLSWMSGHSLMDEIPVIMISSEDANNVVRRAYELGAVDYISRPFDARVVRRRVSNTTRLYVKQRRLSTIVAQQFYEREKNDRIMIDILSQVTAMHNGEDSEHIQRVQILTGILLESLAKKTDSYELSMEERILITMASALHDIGKIAVGGNILRKKTPLTWEETVRMREHPILGVKVLNRLKGYQDESLVKTAREICHWHHERYDGTGYPDRLEGEQIPISAQVVGLADAYDELISGRGGKPIFPYDEAAKKISAGECGAFNPILVDCLTETQGRIKDELEAFKPVDPLDVGW